MRARLFPFILCAAAVVVSTLPAQAPRGPRAQDRPSPIRLVPVIPNWLENLPPPLRILVSPVPDPKSPVAFKQTFGDCGDPCIVTYNPGGTLYVFEFAAKEVLAGAKSLMVINGRCYSACAIFADRAREKVCITTSASFHFHKARREVSQDHGNTKKGEVLEYSDPPHSKDIDAWVKSQPRKYPEKGYTDMYFHEARRFFKECELTPPLPRPRPKASRGKSRPPAPKAPLLRLGSHGLY